jgi:exosortase A
MHSISKRALGMLTIAAFVVLVVVYRDTFLSMVAKWTDDSAFNYGYMIAPISAWLVWRRRHWLDGLQFVPSWTGTFAVAGAALLWTVARGTGVLVAEQIAVVAMIPGIVLAVLGWQAARALLLPLAYLFFMVPLGREIVPWLATMTADIATWALQVTGVPIYRTHLMIIVPGGWFEVAKACSGVAFLMTALALGVLYAYLNYQSWTKRAIAILVAAVVPILANGVRVYITVLISWLTDMRWGSGHEHMVYGQILFIIVLLGTFMIGTRWHDEGPVTPAWLTRSPDRSEHTSFTRLAWVPATLALLILIGAPPYQAAFANQLRASVSAASAAVRLPESAGPWRGPLAEGDSWRPLYGDGLAKIQGTYRNGPDDKVDVFVGVYGLGTTAGSEMISFGNVLYKEEKAVVPDVEIRDVDVGSGHRLQVREVAVPDGGAGRLVWHWYMVGDRRATNGFAVKALEAVAWVTRSAQDERVITLATRSDESAATRLRSFVASNPGCVSSGFAAAACKR